VSNVPTVRSSCEAFGRSDIPAPLGYLSENIGWDDGMAVPGVPWLQPRRGRGCCVCHQGHGPDSGGRGWSSHLGLWRPRAGRAVPPQARHTSTLGCVSRLMKS